MGQTVCYCESEIYSLNIFIFLSLSKKIFFVLLIITDEIWWNLMLPCQRIKAFCKQIFCIGSGWWYVVLDTECSKSDISSCCGAFSTYVPDEQILHRPAPGTSPITQGPSVTLPSHYPWRLSLFQPSFFKPLQLRKVPTEPDCVDVGPLILSLPDSRLQQASDTCSISLTLRIIILNWQMFAVSDTV